MAHQGSHTASQLEYCPRRGHTAASLPSDHSINAACAVMEAVTNQEEDIFDVIIIGAGPCGLATAARLRERAPAANYTDEEHRRYRWIGKHGDMVSVKHVKTGKTTTARAGSHADYKIAVLDATDSKWLGRWNRLFRRLEISHLRSPMLWHIDPKDRDALLTHARAHDRETELIAIHNCVGKEMSKHAKKKRMGRKGCDITQHGRIGITLRESRDYCTPSQSLFWEQCEEVANRYKLSEDILHNETLRDIDYGVVRGVSIDDENLFTVISDKSKRYSRIVVLAVGPANTPKIPTMPSVPDRHPLPQTCHSMDFPEVLDPILADRKAAGYATNVLVVGGGLTSAQISDVTIRRGVTKVWHLMRGPCIVKYFDVDLDWMGKYKNGRQAQFWTCDSDEERLELLRAARGGGSITPLYNKRLKKHISAGSLALHTETKLVDARFGEVDGKSMWSVQTEPPIGDLPNFDLIYFATGIQTDFASLPYLQKMMQKYPIKGMGGFPCLTEDLMWNEDVPLFAVGRLAALQLGPAGHNIGGARMGADRVAWGIEDVIRRSNESS